MAEKKQREVKDFRDDPFMGGSMGDSVISVVLLLIFIAMGIIVFCADIIEIKDPVVKAGAVAYTVSLVIGIVVYIIFKQEAKREFEGMKNKKNKEIGEIQERLHDYMLSSMGRIKELEEENGRLREIIKKTIIL